MDIRNTRELKTFAAERLDQAPDNRRIVLIYALLVVGLAVLTSGLSYVLDLRIRQTGGLSQMGARTVLSALQDMLPMAQSLMVMCLDLGYIAAMLRIARGQYVSPRTLKLGFDRFGVLLRYNILTTLIYSGIGMASVYLASLIFVMGPWGHSFMEKLAPLLMDTSLLSPDLVLEESIALELAPSMLPMFVILAIVLCVLLLPISFRLRMASYVIIDKPGLGAFAALRESGNMMRGNCLKLLKLDISFWWYFLSLFAASLVGNADMWLPLFGVELPLSTDAAYYLFYGIYLAAQLLVYCTVRNRVEVTYALAYDAVKPEEKKTEGVVLGNIFQM